MLLKDWVVTVGLLRRVFVGWQSATRRLSPREVRQDEDRAFESSGEISNESVARVGRCDGTVVVRWNEWRRRYGMVDGKHARSIGSWKKGGRRVHGKSGDGPEFLFLFFFFFLLLFPFSLFARCMTVVGCDYLGTCQRRIVSPPVLFRFALIKGSARSAQVWTIVCCRRRRRGR